MVKNISANTEILLTIHTFFNKRSPTCSKFYTRYNFEKEPLLYTECFKMSFTTLKEYTYLYRGQHTQRFELSQCKKTLQV
jgi:hypothetical protein